MAKSTKAKAKPKATPEKSQYKSTFAKDRIFSVVFICMLLAFVSAGLCGTLYYFWMTRPTPTYIPITPDGKTLQDPTNPYEYKIFLLEPLNKPYLNKKQLFQWVVEAAVSVYTIDFVNFEKDVQSSKPYFTDAGFRQLIRALKDSGAIDDIREKQLIATAVAQGAPIIIDRGTRQGRYFWKLQLPLKVTYQGASELIPQDLVVAMIVTRVPVEENPKGIGIESIDIREGRIQNQSGIR